jgi:hypothetical protein
MSARTHLPHLARRALHLLAAAHHLFAAAPRRFRLSAGQFRSLSDHVQRRIVQPHARI